MADLFARLGARSQGQTTLVRPRPDALYTGRPFVVNEAVSTARPPASVALDADESTTRHPASPADEPRTGGASDPAHQGRQHDGRSSARAGQPGTQNRLDATDYLPKEVARPAGVLDNDAPLPQPAPTAIDRPVRAPITLASVVAALEAGSPAAERSNNAFTDAPRSPAFGGPGMTGSPGTGQRSTEGDVHITIGDVVIRGSTPTSAPSAPAPAAPPRLTLHDYLRGRREPA